jgi:hypothetical protein
MAKRYEIRDLNTHGLLASFDDKNILKKAVKIYRQKKHRVYVVDTEKERKDNNGS